VPRVVVEERLLVLRELEEVRRLLQPLDGLSRVKLALVTRLKEIFLRLEPFAADAIPTFIVAKVQVA
jgi:hypothetical protein